MFGVLVFACVSDYRMSGSYACKNTREKNICCGSKQNRMAFVACCVDGYMRAKYFMFRCSRESMARLCVYVFSVKHAFWRRSHTEWRTFVNLCENRGLTHSPCPGRVVHVTCGMMRYRLVMNTAYVYVCIVCRFKNHNQLNIVALIVN